MRVRPPAIRLPFYAPLFALAAACGDASRPVAAAPRGAPQAASRASARAAARRAVLVFGRAKDSLTLDPAAASDGESAKVIDQIFEGLVRFADDPKNPAELLPCLAVDWECSADRLTWTFRLREDVVFHDGTPFDAEAVAFTFRRLIDPKHPYAPPVSPYRSVFEIVSEIRPLGPHRIRFYLSEPSVVFLRNLAMFCAGIVSPAAVKAEGRNFGRRPVGTGPFRFVAWDQDVSIRLEAFPRWWGERPRDAIQNLVFAQVADPKTRLMRLRSGEIQIADNLSLHDLAALGRDPEIAVDEAPGMNVCYVALNTERPPFQDMRVRRAFALAVDRARLIERGFQGRGRAAYDLLPATVPGSSEKAWPGLDRERARALLEEAGFDFDSEVVLTVMNNPRPYLPDPERVAEILRDQFRRIGVAVRIEKLDWAGFIQKLQRGGHQMALVGWTSDNGDPENFYGPILSARAIGGTNFVRLRHARLEALLQDVREEAEPERRREILAKIQAVLARECPCIPIAHAPVRIARRRSVRGFRLHPIRLSLAGVRLAD